ncbi:DEAD/DEAH box helicase family protein [Streptomyces adustus]|uniref:DEAD/DEAH box helicase family protein n=1 Tax=Streptomyces adustus TaxID=1609272 RepID=UPI0012E0665F|nr:DEAD/DEAH box helicase family protein [Streptomyces adustus]
MSPASPEPAARRVTMRPDQHSGHDRAVRHLHRPGTRGLDVSVCGTGKTPVAIRPARTLGSQLTLVVVPTLELIAQTALTWRKDGRAEARVAVCSMDTRAHQGLTEANGGAFQSVWTAPVRTTASRTNASQILKPNSRRTSPPHLRRRDPGIPTTWLPRADHSNAV